MRKFTRYLLAIVMVSGITTLSVANKSIAAQGFPPEYRGILETKHTKLLSVWGNPDQADPYWILTLTFSPDGTLVLVGGAQPGHNALEGGAMKLWDIATGKEIRAFQGHTRKVKSLAFSPDGTWAVSASTDGTVRQWDVASGNEIRVLKRVQGVEYNLADAVAVSPNGKLLLVGTSEQPGLRLLDVATGNELRAFNVEFGADHVAFSPDGKWALSVSSYESPRLWSVTNGKLIRAFKPGGRWRSLMKLRGAWTAADLSPNGRQLIAGNSDSKIRLWDVATGEELRILRGHRGRVASVKFSPDNRMLLSAGSEDHTVRLWDVESGREIDRIELTSSNDVAYTVAFHPTGRSCIVGTARGVVLHFKLR